MRLGIIDVNMTQAGDDAPHMSYVLVLFPQETHLIDPKAVATARKDNDLQGQYCGV